MFNTVLVATDLSEASEQVIHSLHGLTALGTRKVILVHALGLRHLEVLKYELARYVEPFLAKQKCRLEAQGFETVVVIAPGLPAFEMDRIATEREASMIVVGSHGSSLAREMLLGGVATSILHHTTCPVLVVRLNIRGKDTRSRWEVACDDFLQHVLYCTDFSDTAERAFLYVEKLVESGTKRVTLLHVQDKTRIAGHLEHRLEEFNAIDRDRLERLQRRLEEQGTLEVQTILPYGLPIQEILREAEREDKSLIVMGSQGRGFFAEVVLGSVSHQVVRRAPVPVLLVPALR